MSILWDRDPSAGERFGFVLGADVVRVDTAAALTRAVSANPGEEIVVVGPDIDLEAACGFTEGLRIDHGTVGVILLRRRLDVAILGQALRAGVREVVPADDLTALSDAVTRSRDLSRKLRGAANTVSQTDGKIVTVFSAKGGVGKTTFATNLGAYLASVGMRTLLVDLDLEFGDVGISLQLLPQSTMVDIVKMSGHLDDQGLASAVTKHPSGLEAICAPAEPGEAERIPAGSVAEVLRVARHTYDVVIVDTPPAFTEHVLTAFDLSDTLILIATLDIPALKNLRLTLDTLDLLGSPREARHIVLNRSDAKVGLRAEDVVTSIKQDITVMVPSSHDVPASINRGVPIVLDEPRHPVSLALRQLADEVIRGVEADPSVVPASGRRLLPWGGRR